MSLQRSYLFLQGICSPFFARLADRLKFRGHRIYKINFNVGDAAFWGRRPAWGFRGHTNNLKSYLAERYQTLGITDQILFGDRRPIHRAAVDCSKAFGVHSHVFEEGYFRPFWVTLEREGVNGHSLLPHDPNWFRDVGRRLPESGDETSFHSSFRDRAVYDVVYHVAGMSNRLFFPRYRTHAPENAAVEYLNYTKRLPLLRFYEYRDSALVRDLIQSSMPFFFLPLQLGSDAQIIDHSQFDDMTGALEFVISSFATYAPQNTKLVVKNHPLDTGQINYRTEIQELMNRFGLTGRIAYIETGDLDTLLRHARGTVTVNSTVGALSLALNCPTIALAKPIYNLAGLTFQGALDDFWSEPMAPDADLFRCFRNTVIHATQVNGGFYSREGIALAVENSCRVLEAERSPLEALL